MKKKAKPGDKNKEQLALIMRSLFGDEARQEVRFDPVRLWRFDYAVPAIKLAVEYDGAGGSRGHAGGHSSLTGMSKDREKGNAASLQGWTVLHFTAQHFNPRARSEFKLSTPHETIMLAALVLGWPDWQPTKEP